MDSGSNCRKIHTSCIIDQWIKLNSLTAGKDKLARLIQYLSRFLWYYISKRKNYRDAVARLQILENALSTFRKLLRFGKSWEVLYGTLKTLHLSDGMLRLTTTMSRIYQCLFLISDHLIWLSRAGLLNWNKGKLSDYSCRFWTGSILFNLARDAYEIRQRALEAAPDNLGKKIHLNAGNMPNTIKSIMILADEHPDLFWDTIKNSCDLFIPLTALGKIRLSPGTIGVLGTISSVAGLVAILKPRAKLVPT